MHPSRIANHHGARGLGSLLEPVDLHINLPNTTKAPFISRVGATMVVVEATMADIGAMAAVTDEVEETMTLTMVTPRTARAMPREMVGT